MACKIHHTGSANVEQYFKPVTKDGKRVAYFRGRRLFGKQYDIPRGYTGVILEENKNGTSKHRALVDAGEDIDDEPARQFDAIERFDKVTVWSHETEPRPESDPWISGINDWAYLATLVSRRCGMDFDLQVRHGWRSISRQDPSIWSKL
jgi:ribonuclease H2 subunit C